ncbi:MAG: phosphoglycerate dehydrogenase [Chitinophagales bacterium]
MSEQQLSYPKEKINILLLENINPKAVEQFNAAGYENVELLKKALQDEELIDKLQGVHILGIRSKTQVTKEVLEKADKLLAVGCFCIGTNQVDLDTAAELGITVFNSPYSNTRSVAELVIAEAIMLIRRIPERNHAAHLGKWMKDNQRSYELRGKTIGIVGYGHIGSQVSVLAESLGLNVIYYDIEPKLPLGNADPVKEIETLFEQSDIVTLHVPQTEETKDMVTAQLLQKIKKDAVFINLSRGNVVDLEALKELLESGHIKGAAIDVFPEEPRSNYDPFVSPLQKLPNVILTPHIGGSTIEAQINIGFDVSNKLINLLDNGSTVGSHSVPELNLPVQKDTTRLLHIHKNRTGVLSAINKVFSKYKVNIAGQYLKTNESIGYVVIDFQGDQSSELLQELRNIEHTIRARFLY